MNILKTILIFFVIALSFGVGFLGYEYFVVKSQFVKVSNICSINTNIIEFQKLFIDKVLKTKGEVSYEDRLRLENAAVSTKDNEILNQWHAFLNSKSETDAQDGVRNLLSLFADKLIY